MTTTSQTHLMPPARMNETACGKYFPKDFSRLTSKVTCQKCRKSNAFNVQRYREEQQQEEGAN